MGVLHGMCGMHEENEEDEEGGDMVGLGVVAAQLVDWTDPRKIVDGLSVKEDEEQGRTGDVHLVLAEAVLEKVLTPGCSSEYCPSVFSFPHQRSDAD